VAQATASFCAASYVLPPPSPRHVSVSREVRGDTQISPGIWLAKAPGDARAMSRRSLLEVAVEVGSTVWIMVRSLRTAQHNRRIGTFTSASRVTGHVDELLPFLPNPDWGVVSPFMLTTTANYLVEYNIELHRRAYFPTAPSRLGCLYVFDSVEEAEKVAHTPGWPAERFTTARVSTLHASHRGDMSIITHLRHLHVNSMTDPWPFIEAYWRSEPCPPYELQKLWSAEWERTEPVAIWETLIEGAIEFDVTDG